MESDAGQPSGTATFAELLRHHRIAAALSQEALAERAGLSVRAISDLERGVKTRPYLETVRLLADALDLAAAERTALATSARPALDQSRRSIPVLDQAALPIPPTSLIGRDDEVDRISDLLASTDTRIVTLSGPGGVGKTRLALAIAARVKPAFPDGVIFVPLAHIDDPEIVMPSVAHCLRLRNEQPAILLDRLGGFLRDKRLLLVIDNMEHVLTAVPQLADMVQTAPGVKILATSRTVLHLTGEFERSVTPLAVPEPNEALSCEDAARSPAVRLFVARAGAVRPSFALTSNNAHAISAICERLDGLPLAIELAAARIKLFSPANLLERLDDQFSLLSGGTRDAAPRHQTLRDAIAWSYDLLSPDERKVFRRLSVFRGGWTLDAAEIVTDLGDLPNPIDIMTALVDKSLIQQSTDEADEPRFRMLATVREFASDRLVEAAEEVSIRDQHARYYTELAETAEREFYGPLEIRWLDRCESELGNMRAALGCGLVNGGDLTYTMRIASALCWLWLTRSGMAEGRNWLERAIAEDNDAPTDIRAKALAIAGTIACFQGDHRAAEYLLSQSITLYRQAHQPFEAGRATLMLGGNFLFQGNIEKADCRLVEGYDALETAGDMPWKAFARFWLGALHGVRGELEQSQMYYCKALEFFRSIEFASGIASTLGNVGALEMKRGISGRLKSSCARPSLCGFHSRIDGAWPSICESYHKSPWQTATPNGPCDFMLHPLHSCNHFMPKRRPPRLEFGAKTRCGCNR